jgi:hypothetical protein
MIYFYTVIITPDKFLKSWKSFPTGNPQKLQGMTVRPINILAVSLALQCKLTKVIFWSRCSTNWPLTHNITRLRFLKQLNIPFSIDDSRSVAMFIKLRIHPLSAMSNKKVSPLIEQLARISRWALDVPRSMVQGSPLIWCFRQINRILFLWCNYSIQNTFIHSFLCLIDLVGKQVDN